MNTIDFLKYERFPVSSETLQFMQGMLLLSAKVASLGGQSYILEGCAVSGEIVSAGTMVINGEILPFEGGAKSTYVVVSETKTSVQVYDTPYEGLYANRRVIFGTGTGQQAWSDLKRITDLLTLSTSLQSISDSVAQHTANHTVAWASVSGRPAAYPPAAHSHAWGDVSGKPGAYPPEAHAHSGLAVYLGEFNAAGTTVDKVAGSLPQVTVAIIQEGIYKLKHDIGHVNYIVVGVGANITQSSLRGMFDVTSTECKVTVSDDGSRNNERIRFAIIAF